MIGFFCKNIIIVSLFSSSQMFYVFNDFKTELITCLFDICTYILLVLNKSN